MRLLPRIHYGNSVFVLEMRIKHVISAKNTNSPKAISSGNHVPISPLANTNIIPRMVETGSQIVTPRIYRQCFLIAAKMAAGRATKNAIKSPSRNGTSKPIWIRRIKPIMFIRYTTASTNRMPVPHFRAALLDFG